MCDTGLSIAFDPALPQAVPSGEDVVLDEAITVACGTGVNPDGSVVPGDKKSGLYQLVAPDNLPGVMVTVSDTVPSASFEPYAPGTYVKLTQAPVSTPSAVPFSGAVAWQITLKGDALLTATDAAGNPAMATCTVPPKKK
ncbi:hypothetical protein GCM10023153_33350 [Ornithinibacter aureus]|uniref:Uncharacterized protein n=1 Tax=Ornithinibacter aureus TaxID=622664 RepID=A0ABP8KB79_9MICO|nr:hypothetical protein [Ornithinibacter aureus]KAF0832334.1 hypothetical protein C8E84_0072 [Ornithinibacter aureus]